MRDISISEFVKVNRIKSGFKSQRQLAEESGVTPATISRIEADVQKPNPETLKVLSKYLKSTSYVELMVAAGYWDEDELLEPINLIRETPSQYDNEKEFINELELSDEELLKQFNLQLDGKKLTEDEAKGIIAYLRSLRQFDK